MPPTLPPDKRTVIAAHKHATTLHILAGSGPLSKIADAVRTKIPQPRTTPQGAYGRPVTRVASDDPAKFQPTGSWCLALLVDASTAWEPLVRMGRRVGVEPLSRIRFHLAAGIKDSILEPWGELNSTPQYDAFDDVNELVRHVLEQLNDQNHRDHAAGAVPGLL